MFQRGKRIWPKKVRKRKPQDWNSIGRLKEQKRCREKRKRKSNFPKNIEKSRFILLLKMGEVHKFFSWLGTHPSLFIFFLAISSPPVIG